MHRIAVLVIGVVCFCCSALAETLTFIAQFDPILGETNRSWFAGDNWFAPDTEGQLQPAGRVPLAGEAVIITGTVELGATGIRVKSLVLTNDATLVGGIVAVEQVKMRGGSVFKNATVNALASLDVDGANCTISGGTLTILAISTARLNAFPLPGASLNLADGAIVLLYGRLELFDNSRLIGVGAVPSRLNISGVLNSTNQSVISVAAASKLVIDNSGVIRSYAGTLKFEGNIEWQSGSGVAQFQAADTNALVSFESPLQVPAACTTYFTGSGSCKLMAGAEVQGAIRVGMDAASQTLMSGNAAIFGAVAGSGSLWVEGDGTNGAALVWGNGRLSVPIDIAAGASLRIENVPGSERVLSSCAISNAGASTLSDASVAFEGGALFHNLAGATFEVRGAGAFFGGPPPDGGAFHNLGVFRKIGSGTASFGVSNATAGPNFNNSAIVEVTGGALNLAGGTSVGDFKIAGGALVSFSAGTHELRGGSDFTGPGFVQVGQGSEPAVVRVTGRTTAERIELGSDGTIAGQGMGAFPLLSVNSLTALNNGRVADLNLTVQTVALRDQAEITNCQLSVEADLQVEGTNCVWRRSTVRIEPAALARLGSGALPVALRLEETVLVNAGELSLPASSRIVGDAASTIRVAVGAALSGAGVIDCSLENSGSIRPNGVLTVAQGKAAKLLSAGTVEIGLHSTDAGATHDKLRMLGDVELNGTLLLKPAQGFLPAPGVAYEVVEFGSVSGKFSRLEGEAPAATVWTSTYASNGVTVSLLRLAEVGRGSIANGLFALPFPTVNGWVYLVQASSDLASWETLQVVNGDGSVRSFTDSTAHASRFYRVLIQ